MSRPLDNYDGVAPCCICGALPVLRGGDRVGRLECPNHKSDTMIHGDCSYERNGIPMGFTKTRYLFWSPEQTKREGIPTAIEDWNKIHKNRNYQPKQSSERV